MGKPKTKQKASSSPKSPTATSVDELCENWGKIKAKVDAKLNVWIDERLPSIIQLKIQELIDPAVNKFTITPKFCESVSDSLKCDIEQCRNVVYTCRVKSLEQNSYKPVRRPESNVEFADTREDTDILSLNFRRVKEELGVDLKHEDISRSHRVGNRSPKPRPIIVRLSRYNTKAEILQKRKMLKQNKKPFHVQEDLTQPPAVGIFSGT